MKDPRLTLKFPYGDFSPREEIYCWVFAHTGKARLSCRMAYGRDCRRAGHRGPTPKLRKRIEDLRDQHAAGSLDISVGPWYHYPWAAKIGFPELRYAKKIKDYADA